MTAIQAGHRSGYRLVVERVSGPRPAEAHLRYSLVVTTLAAAMIMGAFAHLAVMRAPRHQVSFGFLVGWGCVSAALAGLVGYPNGFFSGEDEYGQGVVRANRAEAAGADSRDPASGWSHWQRGLGAAAAAATAAGIGLGLASFALLGRPLGFWLLWGWSSVAGGGALVLSIGYGRRRGVLLAGRRDHGLLVESGPSRSWIGRVWITGALPVALFSATVNAALAWASYRWGISSKALGSDLSVSVVLTAVTNYVMGRQWGRADWRAGRVVVPQTAHLPGKLRLGPQGAVFAVVADLLVVTLLGHLLTQPPTTATAVFLRAVAGLLAGGAAFALGATAGIFNTAADEQAA